MPKKSHQGTTRRFTRSPTVIVSPPLKGARHSGQLTSLALPAQAMPFALGWAAGITLAAVADALVWLLLYKP
ncbi:MAG TPA: hypothetical protein DEV81_17805 [Cyanobacteria bacterium UBA11049]|nr:hypothetical protein [Cyanobacteria bacterium UBA11049]